MVDTTMVLLVKHKAMIQACNAAVHLPELCVVLIVVASRPCLWKIIAGAIWLPNIQVNLIESILSYSTCQINPCFACISFTQKNRYSKIVDLLALFSTLLCLTLSHAKNFEEILEVANSRQFWFMQF